MDNSKYLLPREYEMLAILLPDQGEEETKAAVDKVLTYITDQNGTVDSVSADSPWGRRRLAYTIRHEGVDYRDGHYVLAYFTALPNVLTEVERELKLDVNVIRYLILTHDPHMGEKIDESAVEAEGAEGDTTATTEEATEAPAEEAAAVEATEAPAEEAAAVEVTEAPAEEAAAAEVTEAPADEAAAEEAIEAPAEDAAEEATEAPVEEAAADEATEAPVEEAAAEEATEAPAEEAAAEEVTEAPAKEAPVARKKSNKLPDAGEGTEWIAGDGTDTLPEGFPIKGNASSKIYHPEESPNYTNTIAEIYFAQPEVAESHGYRLPKTLEKAAAEAGNAAADAADALKAGDDK